MCYEQSRRSSISPLANKLRLDNDGDQAPSAPVTGTDLGRLRELLGYHLRRAEVVTFQSFAAHMAKRVSPGQLGLLLLVEANPGINQTRIGRTLGIDRSTLVAMVDRLERRGLMARTLTLNDRRSHALRLTRQGESFLKELLAPLARHEQEIARNLSAAERKTLIALLRRVVE